MLTVKVCCEMLATPSTAASVVISVLNPPTESGTTLCAGQNPSGLNCRVLASGHENRPLIPSGTVKARSAAKRLATGVVNVAVICAATPTTSPGLGCTEGTVGVGGLDGAEPGLGGPEATVGLGDVTAAKPGLADPTSTTTNIVSERSARLKVSKGTPVFTQAVDRAKPLLVIGLTRAYQSGPSQSRRRPQPW